MSGQDIGTRIDGAKNLVDAFYRMANSAYEGEVYSQATILHHQESEHVERPWVPATYGQVKQRVNSIVDFLKSLGVAKGDRIAIISNTRPEWMEIDLAILGAGGVVVSVYPSLLACDIGYLLFDSGAKIVFAENEEQVEKLLQLQQEPCKIPATEEREACSEQLCLAKIIAIEDVTAHPLVVQLQSLYAVGKPDADEMAGQLTRDDIATLVYTSGTTGPPKGVIQTHGNHLANVRQGFRGRMYDENSTIMVFLPLAHSFAKLMGYIGFLTPVKLRFPAVADKRSSKADQASITRDIREANAQIVPSVPRILEKMQAAVIRQSTSDSPLAWIVQQTLSVAWSVYTARREKREITKKERVIYFLTGFMRRKIKRLLFGKNFRNAISGGAKISVEVIEFFDSLGIEVLEGYGLTETCVATNVNRYGEKRIGSVGPPLDKDIEVQIAADGEILARGPNVTRGYFNRPSATKQSWDSEGWFHTGDLGAIDKDGYLSVVGRKKELIVTAGGKKISPENVEEKLKTSRYISQAVLVGEGKPYCGALVVINVAEVKSWATKQGITIEGDVHVHPRTKELIDREVHAINEMLASFESVKRTHILPEECTLENGLLTPTFKVKRKEVMKRYQQQIEELFAGASAGKAA